MAKNPRLLWIRNELPEIGLAQVEWPNGGITEFEFSGGAVEKLQYKAQRKPGDVANILKKIAYRETEIKPGAPAKPKKPPPPPPPTFKQTSLFPESKTFEQMLQEAIDLDDTGPVQPEDPGQASLLPPPDVSLETVVSTLLRSKFAPDDEGAGENETDQVNAGVYRYKDNLDVFGLLTGPNGGSVFLSATTFHGEKSVLMKSNMVRQNWYFDHPAQKDTDVAVEVLEYAGYKVPQYQVARPAGTPSWMVIEAQDENKTEAIDVDSLSLTEKQQREAIDLDDTTAPQETPGQLKLLFGGGSLHEIITRLMNKGFTLKPPRFTVDIAEPNIFKHSDGQLFTFLKEPSGIGVIYMVEGPENWEDYPKDKRVRVMAMTSTRDLTHPDKAAVKIATDILKAAGYETEIDPEGLFDHGDFIVESLLLEKHDFACVMGDLHTVAMNIEGLREKVDPKDVVEDEEVDDPHVTILYGFSDSQLEEVKKLLADELPVTGKFEKVDVFENDEHDVVILKIESAGLQALHAKLAKLPNEETFPDYKPHTTIAYVKSGEGKKYKNPETSPFWTSYGDDDKKTKPYVLNEHFTIDRIIFSKQSGGKEIIRLRSKMVKDLKAPVIAAIKQANEGFENHYKPTIYINPVTGAVHVETGDWESEDNDYAPLEDLYAAIKKIDGIKSVDGESETPPHQKEGPWEEVFIKGPRLDRDKKELSEAEESMGQQFADAMEDLIGAGQVSFMGPFVVVNDKGGQTATTLELSFHPTEWGDLPLMSLGFIGVALENRKKGNAARVMGLLTSVADKKGWRMGLDIQPTKMRGDIKVPMSGVNLTRWYKKLGFKRGEFGTYLRDPIGYVESSEPKPNDGVRAVGAVPVTEAKNDATLDSEAAQMLTQYEDEPTSIWLYTQMPVADRMAWAYLAADAFKDVPIKGDMVRAFVEAMVKVTEPPETFWDQIKEKDDIRANYLSQLDWDIKTVKLDEVGVYPSFSGYPAEWCQGNVLDTAKKIEEDEGHPDKKAKIIKMSEKYQTILKFLPPILVPGGILRGERPGYELTKYTCDDGNHRLVAAALAGETEAVCFVGKQKKHQGLPPAAKLVPMKAESLGEAINLGDIPPDPLAQDPGQMSLLPNVTLEDYVREIANTLRYEVTDTQEGDKHIWDRGDRTLRQHYEISYRDPRTTGSFSAEFYGPTKSVEDQKVVLLRVDHSSGGNDAAAVHALSTQLKAAGMVVGSAGPNDFVYQPADSLAAIYQPPPVGTVQEKKLKKIKGAPTILVVGLLAGQAERLRQKFQRKANLLFVVEKEVGVRIPPNADWAIGLTRFINHAQEGIVSRLYGNRYLRVPGGVSAVKMKIENILKGRPHESLQRLEAINIADRTSEPDQIPGQLSLIADKTFDSALDHLADSGWNPIEVEERYHTMLKSYRIYTPDDRYWFSMFMQEPERGGMPYATLMPTALSTELMGIVNKAADDLNQGGFRVTNSYGRAWILQLPDEQLNKPQTEAIDLDDFSAPSPEAPGQLSLFSAGGEVDRLASAIKSIGFVEVPEQTTPNQLWYKDPTTQGAVSLVFTDPDAEGQQKVSLLPNFDPNTQVSSLSPGELGQIMPHYKAYQQVAEVLQALEDVEARAVQAGELMGEAIDIEDRPPLPVSPDDPGQQRLKFLHLSPSVSSMDQVVSMLEAARFKDSREYRRVPARVNSAIGSRGRYDKQIIAMRLPGRSGGWVQISDQRVENWRDGIPMNVLLFSPVADPDEQGRPNDQRAYVLALDTLYNAGMQPLYIHTSVMSTDMSKRSTYLFNGEPHEELQQYVSEQTAGYDPDIGQQMLGTHIGEAIDIDDSPLQVPEDPAQMALPFSKNRVFEAAKVVLKQRGFRETDEPLPGAPSISKDKYVIYKYVARFVQHRNEVGYLLLIAYGDEVSGVESTYIFPGTGGTGGVASRRTSADDMTKNIAAGELRSQGFDLVRFGSGYRVDGMRGEFEEMLEAAFA